MKNRVLSLTMLFAFISCGLFAQNNPETKIHQVGINFSSLNQFGLDYKTGTQKTMLRLSLLSLNIGNNNEWGRNEDSVDIKQQSYGAGFRLGFQKRLPIDTHFDFIWGLEAGCNFNYQKQQNNYTYSSYGNTSWHVTPMVDLVLGVNYTIAEHLVIGVEIAPGFHYSYGKTKSTNANQTVETTSSSFGFGFSNNPASLSLAYRFGK